MNDSRQPSRRDVLRMGLAAGMGLTVGRLPLDAHLAHAAGMMQQPLIMRPIPKTGEQLPVVGLGTNRYSVNTPEDMTARCDVIKRMVELGGKVIDTARGYGRAEEVIGQCIADSGLRDRVFLATKFSLGGGRRGGGTPPDPRAGLEEAFTRLRMQTIDLMMVHNMGGTEQLVPVMNEMKAAGRFRYVGISISSDRNYEELATWMEREPLDFIEIDYSIGNRNSADRLLPLAQERQMAVLINVPFGGRSGSVLSTLGDRPLPDWAAEIDCTTWAQVCLKFVISHPAVTVVHPGTTSVEHIADNLSAARGRLPDAALRTRMQQFYDSLG